MAPILRLRKHFTDAHGAQDASRFHRYLLTTNFGDWTIVPLQYLPDTHTAMYAERGWWHRLRKWCLNDVAPGIPRDGGRSKSYSAQISTVLRELRTAKSNHDHPRVQYSKTALQELSNKLSLPLLQGVIITVPNMSANQKRVIANFIHRALKRTGKPLWERQAMSGRIRIVRTNPHTLRSILEAQANQRGRFKIRPSCKCSALSIWEVGIFIAEAGT